MAYELPDGWRLRPIGDIAEVIGGGTPKTADPTYWDGGVPWITPRDLSGYQERFIERGDRDISPAGLKASSARMLPGNAVLVSSRAPIGYVALASAPVTTNQGFRSLVLRDDHVPEFFYYALRASKQKLDAAASGSTFREISGTAMKGVVLAVPPAPEQRRIADVLGTLDELVSTERRVWRDAHAACEAFFKHTFLRTPQRQPLSEFATLHKSNVRPLDEPTTMFEHFSIPSFDEARLPTVELGEAMLSGKTRLPPGDCVLFSKLNPATLRVWWPRPDRFEHAVCSPEFIVLVAKASSSTSFLYASLLHDVGLHKEILSHATGTTTSRQRVKPTDVLTCRMVSPKQDELEAWNGFSVPMYSRARFAMSRARRVMAVRDALLPRLVSGRLRVPETYDVAGWVAQQAEAGATPMATAS